MKRIIFILIIFIYNFSFSQQIGNFSLNNKEIIWQKIYQKTGIKSELEKKILKSINQLYGQNSLTFHLNDISMNCNNIMQLYNSKFRFLVIIEVKDNKYRVTIKNIYFTSPNPYLGDFEFSDFFTRQNKTKFRKNKHTTNAIRCIDKYFYNLFQLKESSNNW